MKLLNEPADKLERGILLANRCTSVIPINEYNGDNEMVRRLASNIQIPAQIEFVSRIT
jgi:hypothetical protein